VRTVTEATEVDRYVVANAFVSTLPAIVIAGAEAYKLLLKTEIDESGEGARTAFAC
jgi:hypothetical protein